MMTAEEALAYLEARSGAIVARSFLEVFMEDPMVSTIGVAIDDEANVCHIIAQTPLGPTTADVPLQDSDDLSFWMHAHHDDGSTSLIYSENVKHGESGASAEAERLIRGETGT